MRKRQLSLATLAFALVFLTGCAPMVTLEPAEDANNSECAEIIVRLPDELAGEQKRRVNAQSTGCLLYTSPSPRDRQKSRMPSSA